MRWVHAGAYKRTQSSTALLIHTSVPLRYTHQILLQFLLPLPLLFSFTSKPHPLWFLPSNQPSHVYFPPLLGSLPGPDQRVHGPLGTPFGPGPLFSNLKSSQTPLPTHWWNGGVYQDQPLASIPTMHLTQDRALGVVVLIWLGALLSALALASNLFLSSRPSSVHGNLGGPIRPICDNAQQLIFRINVKNVFTIYWPKFLFYYS